MILKLGSKGDSVKQLQKFLGLNPDGDFGTKTEYAVKKWQKDNGLTSDGIVGQITFEKMGLLSTDVSETVTHNETTGLIINKHYMPTKEYCAGPIKPGYIFLHHTAGWHNPYNTIDDWAKDTRGRIAVEFVIGGQSIKGNDDKYDGIVAQSFPDGNWGYHLGDCGSQSMHKNSVGIEVCNFGGIKDGKNYVGIVADKSQIVTLNESYRGYKEYHRYSDAQIDALHKLILHIGERDHIDVRKGLPELIRKIGVKAFDWSDDAYKGNIKGILTHAMVRKDKNDMFPQQELIDMLLSL